MNLHLHLSRVAAVAFRRMVGVTTPIAFTVPPSLGDPGTPARRYGAPLGHTPESHAPYRPLPACSCNPYTDMVTRAQSRDAGRTNRDRYVHTSVSTDMAHAANDEGDGRPTDLPARRATVVYNGHTYDAADFQRERLAFVTAFDHPGTLGQWLNTHLAPLSPSEAGDVAPFPTTPDGDLRDRLSGQPFTRLPLF